MEINVILSVNWIKHIQKQTQIDEKKIFGPKYVEKSRFVNLLSSKSASLNFICLDEFQWNLLHDLNFALSSSIDKYLLLEKNLPHRYSAVR